MSIPNTEYFLSARYKHSTMMFSCKTKVGLINIASNLKGTYSNSKTFLITTD